MNNFDSNYYGVDSETAASLLGSGLVDELFYLKDLERRKMFVLCNIEQDEISDTVRHILQINSEDAAIPPEKRTPILLYISSNGGDVDAGFELIDVIRTSKTPVYTINIGSWYSMGFLIGIAGHKRFAMPNSRFLMHDGSSLLYNSGAKVHDQMEFQKKLDTRIRQYVIDRSKITEEKYDENLRVEWYMFAEDAKADGFIEYIVGVDCDLDMVV